MAKNVSKLSIIDYISILAAIAGTVTVFYSAIEILNENSYYLLAGGLTVLLASAYFVYKAIEKVAEKQKQYYGSLWIGYLTSIFLFSASILFTPVAVLEENSVSWRFSLLKGGVTRSEKESETGKIEYTRYSPPENARQDIQIIGITTNTLEKLQGTWPLPWNYYANVINTFKDTSNWLMFDIFFIDYKKGQTEEMSAALDKNPNVLFDFPMETSAESKESVVNLEERIQILKKYKLKHVEDPDGKGLVWVKFPVPPIEPISSRAAGLGYANVKKDESGLNRKMPLVVKLPVYERAGGFEFYPSIDLVIVANYYGINPAEDIEVKMGSYVKIKNIPKKNITFFNRKTLKMETSDIMKTPNPNREIIIPIDWEGQMEINFVGGRYSFKTHELFEVATEWNEEAASQFQHTIFLVAMYYATGRGASKDEHLSPFGEMSGIEHHAHTINTILNQDFIFNIPVWANLLIYLFFGLLIGYVQPRLPTMMGFINISVLMILYAVLSLALFSQFNLKIIFPSVLLLQIFAFVLITGFKILTEEENVKYIRNTFSKFVSKDVVDELLKDPGNLALGGSKRDITIFFSDIRGFTTISETLGPEELVQLLNEYLSEMTELVIQYKGTIDKYMGDAIMAFWGAPVPLEDHAYYACVASLMQMKKLNELREAWKARGVPMIDIGIGLNSGPAVVGNMGSSHRMEYTCMGDTINLGSRLEGSNKMYGTHIILSEYTYEKVKDKVFARELDLVTVKGKTQPVRIYELLGLVNEGDFDALKRSLGASKN